MWHLPQNENNQVLHFLHNSSCHDELPQLILLFHTSSSRLPRRERWRTSSSRVGQTTASHIRPRLSCRSCSTSDKSRPNALQSWNWPSNLRSLSTAVQASDEQVCLSCLPWWSWVVHPVSLFFRASHLWIEVRRFWCWVDLDGGFLIQFPLFFSYLSMLSVIFTLFFDWRTDLATPVA